MTSNLIDSLFDLLACEREALVCGDFNALHDLGVRKEEIIDKISGGPPLEADRYHGLQDKIERNQRLLTSAQEGIKAVANRLAEMQRVRQGLETYDRTGQRSRIATRQPVNLEKRA